MTVEEYQLALCLAGTTVRNSAGEERFVPLLEGVREKCPTCASWNDWERDHVKPPCPLCQGRSWVPSRAFRKYGQAFKVLPWFSMGLMYGQIQRVAFSIFKDELESYSALAEVLGVGQ